MHPKYRAEEVQLYFRKMFHQLAFIETFSGAVYGVVQFSVQRAPCTDSQHSQYYV